MALSEEKLGYLRFSDKLCALPISAKEDQRHGFGLLEKTIRSAEP
jgi:hypothetical protein